jgi:hypothetical protein
MLGGTDMPVHDWTKVDAGIFHAFHHIWITALHGAVSARLPPSYYCLPEQVAGVGNPDVLTLQFTIPNPPPPLANGNGSHKPNESGGVAVATAPPRARFTARSEAIGRRPKSVVVRHVSGHRIVAIIEVVSPANKATEAAIRALAEKAANFLRTGVHLLFLDLFPPSARDPNGIHPVIWSQIEEQPFALPPDKPLTLAAYSAGLALEAFIEPVAVGDVLPDMPLFLTPDAHIPVPLEATYREAWAKIPSPWREVLEPSAA